MNALVLEAVVTEEHQLHCALPTSLPTGCRLRVVIEPLLDEAPAQNQPSRALTGDAVVDHYQPRSALGRQLIELRQAYVESGGKRMSWDEIDAEVRERRGGVADD
jgi:hypothetical protein